MKETYVWVPWFQELADKIAGGGEKYLIKQAKRVDWKKDNPALLQFGDENIDPFSFFYYLARCNGLKKRKDIYASVSEIFGIDGKNILANKNSKDDFIFPTPIPNALALFHDGKNGNPDLLWKLFRQAVKPDVKINADDFAEILKIKGVGVQKLTQCLFLINPHYFMPVDKGILKFHSGFNLPSFKEAKKKIGQPNGWEYYKETMLKGFHAAFPECMVYEINTALYLMGCWENENITIGKNFFQISTNVLDDGKDCWEEFSKENHVRTGGWASGYVFGKKGDPKKPYPLTESSEGDIILVRTGLHLGRGIGVVYKNDYAEKGLTKENVIHVLWLNKSEAKFEKFTTMSGFSKVSSVGETYKAFETADLYKSTFEMIKYINSEDGGGGQDRVEDTQIHPLNQILYGPPGTGKTWNTVNHALAIIEGKAVQELENKDRKALKERFDELKELGQIEMVTFHQNFSYEDFIEGIRPILGSDSEDNPNNLQYRIVSGIFKKIADRANENLRKQSCSRTKINFDAMLEDYVKDVERKYAEGEGVTLQIRGRKMASITKINRKEAGKIESIAISGEKLSSIAYSISDDLLPFAKLLASNAMLHHGRTLSIAECLRRGFWLDGVFNKNWTDSNGRSIGNRRPENVVVAASFGFAMNEENEMLVAPYHPSMKKLFKDSKYSQIDLVNYFNSLPNVTTAYNDKGNKKIIFCGGTRRTCLAIAQETLEAVGFFPPCPEDADYMRSQGDEDSNPPTEISEQTYCLKWKEVQQHYTKFYNNEISPNNDILSQESNQKHIYSNLYFAFFKQIKKFHDTWTPEEKQSNQSVEKLNYVLIIDEINRGNIAKIFGELITLIEDSKRIGNEDETTVTLPYSSDNDDEKEAFGVPNNLYILGTMNTADRSIALLDTALRRRFDFIEMLPQENHSLISDNVDGVNCRKLLENMNQRISVLLDREHQIGHGYFIGVDSMEKLSRTFKNKIIPLLQEYFYEDWEKIILVLNDNKFVIKSKIPDGLFKRAGDELVDADRLIYALIAADSGEWENPEKYQKIYARKQTQSDENDGE